MATIPANLSDITQALAELLKLNVERIAAGSIGSITVSKIPPEKADEAGDTRLNIHLYHVAQDNDGGPDLPIGGAPRNPIATRPLPVKLFYVLTSHAMINENSDDVASQHALMGWALKTLHDFGEIFEDTVVEGTPIFDTGITLAGRPIDIIIRPLEPEESVSFWSVDQVRTARLSAFLELRTLLLPPEPRVHVAGIVGDFTLGVFGSGAPRLEGTSSIMEFEFPKVLGNAVSRVPRDPAVAVLHVLAGSDDAKVRIAGSAIGDGRRSLLVLRGETLPSPAAIDPSANPTWNITFEGQEIALETRPSAVADIGGVVGPIGLLPGLYSLSLRLPHDLSTESGLTRRSSLESNRVFLALAPAISTAQPMAMPNPKHIEIDMDAAYDVTLPSLDTQVSIGGDVYRKVDAFIGNAAKDAGTFIARNGHFYEAAPAATLAAGTYPVRVSVNGVDAPPFWMEIV